MRILLATIGSAGDVYPLLRVGVALQRRGQRVQVLANAHFERHVREAKLSFSELGSEDAYRAVVASPDLWHPQRAFGVIARGFVLPLMRPLYELVAQHDPAETIVVASGLCLGARIAQESLGFHLVTMHLQPAVLQSAHQPPRLGGLALPGWLPLALRRAALRGVDRLVTDPILAPEVNAFRTELGLPPVKQIFSVWMHSPHRVIGLFPAWFSAPQADWPANTVLTGFVGGGLGAEEGLSAEVETFLAAGEAPVVFTPGTAMQHGERFFRESMMACKLLGCRAIFVTRYREHLPSKLPDDTMHVPYAPFEMLLPHAAVLVYHGGIGTLAQALAAGIPQLIMPMSHDQPDNAVRIKHLGVGDWLWPRAYRGRRVASRLSDLLESGQIGGRCKQVRQMVDFDKALEETCRAIEGVSFEDVLV